MMAIIRLISLSIFIVSLHIDAHTRICETQGTCRNCGDNRYSYYKCASNVECFAGETCLDGFCCPNINTDIVRRHHEQYHELVDDANRSRIDFEIDHNTSIDTNQHDHRNNPCPDGSTWLRPCKTDTDCLFRDEICAEDKCCSSCHQRRIQVMKELPTNDLYGVHLPQCTEDGKHYRAEQCRAGSTTVCWCVTQFGRELKDQLDTPTSDRQSCEQLRNSREKVDDEKQQKVVVEIRRSPPRLTNVYRLTSTMTSSPTNDNDANRICTIVRPGICHEGPLQALDMDRSRSVSYHRCACDDDCFGRQKCCLEMNGRRCADPTNRAAFGLSVVCNTNEQYVSCYNPCQPSCTNQQQLPCASFVCQPGCHCLPGYVRADSDPRSSCIARVQCALSSNIDTGVGTCADPLKHWRNCGSVCPISCETRNRPPGLCDSRCVPGCFCKIPYILETSINWQQQPVRCILPAQCPLLGTAGGSIVALPIVPIDLGGGGGYVQQPSNCDDPLKEFRACGSACAPGCGAGRNERVCAPQCVAGCFCRHPYILADVNDRRSACVLEQQCGPVRGDGDQQPDQQSCNDPRKEWSTCGSTCPRSCLNLEPTCDSQHCVQGCFCREPYVLVDPFDRTSRCVLPSECIGQNHCSDARKEYQSCGSSCPIGCNNLTPQTCTPCIAGCFCRPGYVFEDATNWRTSPCIATNECPSNHTTAFDSCPTSATGDRSGRLCGIDSDCPTGQKCCTAQQSDVSLSSVQRRCICPDPNSMWTSCGSQCPEYCEQNSTPICSPSCNPGCQCAPGYVKSRNDLTAMCVLRSQCPLASPSSSSTTSALRSASVQLISKNGQLLGVLRITQDEFDNRLRLHGSLADLPSGQHALVLHQFGDVSDNCTNVGPLYHAISESTAIIGNVTVDAFGDAQVDFVKDVELNMIESIIGRAIVLHDESVLEWSLRTGDQAPIACGTIGVTKKI